jgi:hypothetical protein
MIKKISLLFLCVFLINSFCLAQWVSINKNSLPDSKPNVQLISDDITGTVIKIELPRLRIDEFNADGKTYHSINFGSDAITTEVGLPEIPHIARVLAIPNQGTISVEVLETGESQIIKGINIPPARESWVEGKPETQYLENEESYRSANFYPQEIVSVEDPAVFRDFRIARVSIFPIRYSPAKQEVEAFSSITIRINYGPGFGINPKLSPQKPIAPSFAKLYKSFIFNYDEVIEREYYGDEEGFDVMLCIMPDFLEPDFQTYAAWKHKTGTYIHVTKFSEIGANENNPTAVKNHILDAYNTWENPPTHILIVGDDGVAPVKYITMDNWTFVTENYFVELEGNDYFPEMMIGRFTNQGDYRMRVMINKFIDYEKSPYTEDPDWFRKGLTCSNNAYISQIYTKRFTADRMLEDGNFISVDSMYNGYPCPGNENDIVNMINEGRSYLNYRGEGWSSGWWASCIPFQTSDVNSLNNGQKLTFVTSIGCGVAMFDANGGNCFGEAWVQLGAEFEPRGACAFVGPTSNTHTTYNNKIDMGIYEGMFISGLDSPGEVLMRGRLYMYMIFGNTFWVDYHYRIYCVLGDPSLHVWKDTPKNISVTYTDTVTVGFSQPQVTVTYSSSGLPVENAEICISGNDVYTVGLTSQGGTAILDIIPSTIGELDLVVRGGTVVPFTGNIQVVEGVENVALAGDPVVTDMDGNNDGLINPNENGTITFSLRNYGTQTSNNVYARLAVPDSVSNFVEILTIDSLSFGNLAPNDSVEGPPFQFFVKPGCAVGFKIPFRLHVSSTTSTWDYFWNETVHGCQLEYTEHFIDDDGNVLNNYRMDPGETVKLILEISNIGDDIAPDVKGVLRSTDQYITIIDSIGTFETILIDSNAINESNYFVVEISENCPVPYLAAYSVQLLTQNGLYSYSIIDTFSIPVAMPSVYDPTGPDEYGYYAYSSDDNLWQQSPEYNWAEISGTGTEITRPGNTSNFTQTVTLPFTFQYYGNNFSQVRISTDGWIALGSGTQIAPENFHLPYLDDINNMIAAFWDDLFSTNPAEDGKLFYQSDVDNHRFIIEWSEVGHFGDYTNKETFEIILFDPAYYNTSTGDGEIICQYKNISEPGTSTVGIENSSEDVGIQYVYNEMYNLTASELVDNFAIKFTTNAPTVVSVDDEISSDNILPDAYVLEQNYPNPFNPETRIRYAIPEPGHVTLKIYDVHGQLIRTLQDENQLPGRYERIWDGNNEYSNKVSSGVYFYRLQSNNFTQVRKMILLK